VPRVSRLMALALRIDGLIQQGVVKDLAEAARLCHVSRARLSQIMGLVNLAPDLVEHLLFLPKAVGGRDAVSERELRRIVVELDWKRQRQMWMELRETNLEPSIGCDQEGPSLSSLDSDGRR